MIFQHFGHTQQFKVYEVENGAVVSSEVVDTNGSGHGALAGLLSSMQVNVLICGGIGGGAQMALASAGIKLYGGIAGEADEAVAALLAGNLDYNPAPNCNHHDHHYGEGHSCGSHGCGGHCGH
jgi:predicted Fe-Mo cluster-binding NifX family protein